MLDLCSLGVLELDICSLALVLDLRSHVFVLDLCSLVLVLDFCNLVLVLDLYSLVLVLDLCRLGGLVLDLCSLVLVLDLFSLVLVLDLCNLGLPNVNAVGRISFKIKVFCGRQAIREEREKGPSLTGVLRVQTYFFLLWIEGWVGWGRGGGWRADETKLALAQ